MFYGIYLLVTGSPFIGTLLYAFGSYISGWTGHDYSHQAVFKTTDSTKEKLYYRLHTGIAAFLAFVQGYELMWWKARHNTHHVVTNEIDLDPDIKLHPVFTYFNKQNMNFVQKLQPIYYVPLLTLLDVYWKLESLMYIVTRFNKMKFQFCRLVVFWIGTYCIFPNVYYLLLQMAIKGFLTGVVVFSTHYAEDRISGNHNMDFVTQTSMTSRNISGGIIVDYLTGGISRQIEHHLFPTMPTYNIRKSTPFVKQYFKDNGLEFRESSIIDCVKKNIVALTQGNDVNIISSVQQD